MFAKDDQKGQGNTKKTIYFSQIKNGKNFLTFMNFTFLKIPVHIHPSFWILVLLFSGIIESLTIASFFYVFIIFISLIVHEYGHGLVALYFDGSPKIELHAFGGTTYHNNNLTKKQDFLITLAGPLSESILIIIPYYFLKFQIFHYHYANYFLFLTYKINLFWCLVNLIPIYPLDGGRLCKYLLSTKFGTKGDRVSIIISIICGVLGSSYFLINKYYMFGSIFLLYGLQNLQMLKQFNLFSYKSNYFSLYNESLRAIENNELSKAKNILNKILKSKSDDSIKISAIESLANIYDKENEKKKAYNLLLKTDHSKLREGKCLLCKLAYEDKNFSLIEKYSSDIYEINPSKEIAILNSKTFANLKDPELSAGWLKTASLFENTEIDFLKEILKDKIYDSIRENAKFKETLSGIISF